MRTAARLLRSEVEEGEVEVEEDLGADRAHTTGTKGDEQAQHARPAACRTAGGRSDQPGEGRRRCDALDNATTLSCRPAYRTALHRPSGAPPRCSSFIFVSTKILFFFIGAAGREDGWIIRILGPPHEQGRGASLKCVRDNVRSR